MAGELVFITGGNGHIGYRVIVLALEAGYRVRAAVRSQAKADKILNAPSIKAIKPSDRLSFVTVPDLLADGAYDEAIKGADYAIHIASPITSGLTDPDVFKSHLLEPAVKGTLAILTAAHKTPSIKRVVITSSVMALIPWHDIMEAETDLVLTEESRTPNSPGPFSSEFEAYSASKVHALNATENWIRTQNPPFSVVHIHPSFVIGADELVTEKSDLFRGTNAQILGPVVAGAKPPHPVLGATIHLDDTATAHVKALDAHHIPDGQSLVTSSGGIRGIQWGDSIEIVKRRYPAAVASGVLPVNGRVLTKVTLIDTTRTEKLLDYRFKSFEDQVTSVIDHYLALVGVEAA